MVFDSEDVLRAPKGSEIWHLTRNVAYRLGGCGYSEKPQENWDRAQIAILDFPGYLFDRAWEENSFKAYLERTARKIADERGELGDPSKMEENWLRATNRVATEVVEINIAHGHLCMHMADSQLDVL